MTPGLLTIGRRAVWEAIDNWPPLANVFRMKLRGEAHGHGYKPVEAFNLRDAPTAESELPALAISPATVEHDWILNQMGQSNYALAVVTWTPGWEWTYAEWLWEEIWRAVAGNKPAEATSLMTYVNRPPSQGGTGFGPSLLAGRFTRVRIGTADNEESRRKVLMHTFGIGLKLNIQALRR